jgi:signal peptidase I
MSAAGSGDGFGSSSEWQPPWERSDPTRPTSGQADDTAVDAFGPVEPSARFTSSERMPTFTPIDRSAGQSPSAGQSSSAGQSPDGGAGSVGAPADVGGGAGGSGDGAASGGGRAAARARARGGPSHRKPGTRGAHRYRLFRQKNVWVELVGLVAIALTLTLVIKTYVVQAFFIPSGSMQNTLEIGDRVLVNKMVYDFRGIHRGDIVVFDGAGTWDPQAPGAPGDPIVRLWDAIEGVFGIGQGDIYIKRVIGLPGDRVACCNASGQITVNGVPLNESSYLYPGNQSGSGDAQPYSVVVPQGSLWVLGDHRAISYDSRGHMGDPGGGAIPESAVLGRAFVIIWPPSQWNILNIPATFEQPKLNASTASGQASAASIAALDRGITVRPSWTPLPLALGFAGAVPLTWLQRRTRRYLTGRLRRYLTGRLGRGRG